MDEGLIRGPDHVHEFNFVGMVHSVGGYRPGSDAQDRVYEERYVCRFCLKTIHRNARTEGNTYGRAIEGTFPKA